MEGYSVLHVFGASGDTQEGVRPEGALLLQDQYLYGAARNAGEYGLGTLYRLNLSLAKRRVVRGPDAGLMR
jgi:hypothetical protein